MSDFTCLSEIRCFYPSKLGSQFSLWLSGRVLESRSRGCMFEPQRRHCVMSLSKTHYPLLSTEKKNEKKAPDPPLFL